MLTVGGNKERFRRLLGKFHRVWTSCGKRHGLEEKMLWCCGWSFSGEKVPWEQHPTPVGRARGSIALESQPPPLSPKAL